MYFWLALRTIIPNIFGLSAGRILIQMFKGTSASNLMKASYFWKFPDGTFRKKRQLLPRKRYNFKKVSYYKLLYLTIVKLDEARNMDRYILYSHVHTFHNFQLEHPVISQMIFTVVQTLNAQLQNSNLLSSRWVSDAEAEVSEALGCSGLEVNRICDLSSV